MTKNDSGHMWNGHAAKLIAQLGLPQFNAWFGCANFVPGSPVVIEVEKPFQRDWINQRYSKQLNSCYGAHIVRTK